MTRKGNHRQYVLDQLPTLLDKSRKRGNHFKQDRDKQAKRAKYWLKTAEKEREAKTELKADIENTAEREAKAEEETNEETEITIADLEDEEGYDSEDEWYRATWVNKGDGWKERVRAMKSVIGLLSQLMIFPPPIAHTHYFNLALESHPRQATPESMSLGSVVAGGNALQGYNKTRPMFVLYPDVKCL
ncbi:hypothetical protein CPB85DRAFT_1437452 [Mucidula mucida]|nr:hypothetical protein CPB85DRAFT_1437452 [Mucidula mucida]